MKSMVKMKPEYDFGGIFGQSSKNHDKIPMTILRSRQMHPFQDELFLSPFIQKALLLLVLILSDQKRENYHPFQTNQNLQTIYHYKKATISW